VAADEQEPLVGEVVLRNNTGMPGEQTVQPTRRLYVARGLVAVNSAVFIVMVLTGVSFWEPSSAALLHWGALNPILLLEGQRWRLVTSAFVHVGIVHLGVNMWCLWYLAELSETVFGAWTTVAIYVLTAMTSGILSTTWHLHNHQVMSTSAGASGAIFGLAGAVILALRIGPQKVPLPVRRAISNSALRFAFVNLIFGIAVGRFIDNAAHMGGLVGGLILGAAYAGTGSLVVQQDLPLRRALVSFVFLLGLTALMYYLFPLHRIPHVQAASFRL
jgi:rhomboid protease GluP